MSDTPHNPYAPPAGSETEPEPPVHGWSVQGDLLVVREGTRLPAVDLDGRGAGGPLTPLAVKLPVPVGGKLLLLMAVVAGALVAYLAYERGVRHRSGIPGVVVILIGSQFLLRGVKIRSAPAFLCGHASIKVLRARLRRARWRSRLGWMGLILLGVMFATLGSLSRLATTVPDFWLVIVWLIAGVGGLGAILCGLVWQGFDAGWTCRKAQGGWLWIKGVGPTGLAEFARRAAEPIPPPRMRKVVVTRAHRLPLGALTRHHPWNPWAWFYLAVMKLTRSKALEIPMFHWSEREWLPPDEGDPELLEQWARDTAGTPLAGWRAIGAVRIDAPGGHMCIHESAFLSPDGQHVGLTAATRVANGKVFMDVRTTAFRSWTTDGLTLATGSDPAETPFPPEIRYLRAKGSPWEIARVHFQRAAGNDLETVDAAGVRAREEAELELRLQATQAAGICGPVEEKELPG